MNNQKTNQIHQTTTKFNQVTGSINYLIKQLNIQKLQSCKPTKTNNPQTSPNHKRRTSKYKVHNKQPVKQTQSYNNQTNQAKRKLNS